MFLTTEPSISGRPYSILRVIFGVGCVNESAFLESTQARAFEIAIEVALGDLAKQGGKLGADGVIGVHLSTSTEGVWHNATVMGTAIKFQQP